MTEPPVKRRKVEGLEASTIATAEDTQTQEDEVIAPTSGLEARPSFANALTQMKEASGDAGDSEGGANLWARPEISDFDKINDAIVFQHLETQDSDTDPTLKIFGVTQKGHSVLVHITGFHPYFYILAPQGFQTSDVLSLKTYLNKQLANQPVFNISVVSKRDIMGYKGEAEQDFVKVEVTSQSRLNTVHDNVQTYEAKAPYVMRFMVDTKIKGMGWVELPGSSCTVVDKKASHCQLEVSIAWDKVAAYSSTNDDTKTVPLRILSFDIETAVRGDIFPHSDHDQVFQISSMVTTPGTSDPFIRNVFTVGECEPIDGAQVLSFDTEAKMLVAWRDFVREVDPDVITGFNISFFDLPFIFGRAKKCKIWDFGDLGRLKGILSPRPKTEWFDDPSMPRGRRSVTETPVAGRVVMDMWQYIRREFKFDMSKKEYQLESLSERFLSDGKEGLSFRDITPLFHKGPDGRAKLAVYCLKDSYLSLQLMRRLNAFECCSKMANVTGVPLSWIPSHGQPMKVLSLLLSEAGQGNYVIPTLKKPIETLEERYRDPHFGFYTTPPGGRNYWKWAPEDGGLSSNDVVTSLTTKLPNRAKAIIANNICYSTHIGKAVADELGLAENKNYARMPNNELCVKADIRQGVPPQVIERVVLTREQTERVRYELGLFDQKISNGVRLAWDICANAVYDFAVSDKLPCLPLLHSRATGAAQKSKGHAGR